MSINTNFSYKEANHRQSFNVTPQTTNGVVLNIQHTINMGHGHNQHIRFLHASFNSTGESLAASNHLGNVYIFDFLINKYWLLVHINCSIVKFSTNFNTSTKELVFIGTTKGNIEVYNSHTSQHVASLNGHKSLVSEVSFSNNEKCVSLGNNEAILWNLIGFTKLQVLHLEEGAVLKFVMFIPVSNDVVACFNDETVQIWAANTYEPIKQIGTNVAGSFQKLIIRSIAFTSNGKLMAVVGHAPTVYVFDVDTLHLMKEFTFTDMHATIKKASFLPNLFDDGMNKIISFLTSSGTLFFYDMLAETYINKIRMEDEVWKYSVDPSSNKIATISRNGNVQIHLLGHVLIKLNRGKTISSIYSRNSVTKTKRNSFKGKSEEILKTEFSAVLETNKLKAILREFGEYPSMYRKIIWKYLLDLPSDEAQYTSVSVNVCEHAFTEFEKNYPLHVKQDMNSLKRFTENLVTWCPFLSVVGYLPVLIFPFIKYLQNDPIFCFETLISIIVNYCQYWFEYYPIPPLNILGLVETILIQQDLELVEHFNKKGVTSKTYAWFILQSMFSEVLSSSNWLIFIDHLFTHDAVFLIVAVAAYSLVNKCVLMTLANYDDFEFFFRTNSVLDFKRFIDKCYKLLKDKSIKDHPRLYIKQITIFKNGNYPVFDQYPKNCLEVCRSINNLRSEVNCLKKEGQSMDIKMEEIEKLKDLERTSQEFVRQTELNKLYCEQLQEEQLIACQERERLKSQVLKSENTLHRNTQQMIQGFVEENRPTLNKLKDTNDRKYSKIEENLLTHYTNLLKHKIQIEGLIDEDVPLDFVRLKKSYKEMTDEFQRTQANTAVPSKEYLKQLNIVTGLAAVNSLIQKVESKIANKGVPDCKTSNKYVVSKLASESEELSQEINKLMGLLSKN